MSSTFQPAFATLKFERPVLLTSARDGTRRLFVVEQAGMIRVFPEKGDAASSQIFLDLSSQVLSPSSGGGEEEGLLGLAFDPQFSKNGRFYVYYSDSSPRRNVLARYQASPDGARGLPQTGVVLLEQEKPFSNHNGGMLAFGPDRMLYLGIGDGGGGGDPSGNAQNLSTLLGKILRINVSSGGSRYEIPPDNPFASRPGARKEVWAYGLRNPWRFSFDRETGELWAGDAGQNSYEEIDRIEKGGNYGWNYFEASHPFENPPDLPASQFIAPVYEYPSSSGGAVIGGYVYRGPLAEARGLYFYGDFVQGKVWALKIEGGKAVSNSEIAGIERLSAFGEGEDGDLYAMSISGSIWRLR